MCLPLYHQNDKDVTLSDSIRGPNSNSDFPSHKYSQVTWLAQVTPFSARPTFSNLQSLRQSCSSFTLGGRAGSLFGIHQCLNILVASKSTQSGQVQGERFSNVNQIWFSLS